MKDKILIADDSVSMRQMLKIILTKAGYEFVEANDGQEALKLFSDEFMLVITDLNMPNMNGIELIRSIRNGNVNSSVPIVMVTTESEESMKMEGRKAGATAWIVKPFNEEKLLAVIKKISGEVSF
ncbi:MAG: response regulator [Spirochaetales bacterium]|nr:response regulator [Spirochaetales bacterium]